MEARNFGKPPTESLAKLESSKAADAIDKRGTVVFFSHMSLLVCVWPCTRQRRSGGFKMNMKLGCGGGGPLEGAIQGCLTGFANKCACLIHMQSMQQSECVSWALLKLEGHPSLQGALNKVRNLYQQEGPACYEKYFGL